MTRNSIKNKSKLLLIFLLIGLLCTSLFFAVACNEAKDPDSDKKTSFTYTESDNGFISNATFTLATGNIKLSDFPKTSVSGWTKSAESDMSTSSAKSGVIDTSDAGWTEVVKNLYSDNYFLNYFKVMYGLEESDFEDAYRKDNNKEESYNPTAAELKDYVIENYIDDVNKSFKYYNDAISNQFKNPGKPDGATDNYVYMLNNYMSKSNVGLGTAQSIASSSTLNLKKGQVAEISVWIKTQNVYGAYGDNFGANIKIGGTVNGNDVSPFGIFNINTNDTWEKYTIYVFADEVHGVSFNLSLGLGYDQLSATEGTVYFDEINYKVLTDEEKTELYAGLSNGTITHPTAYASIDDTSKAVKLYAKDTNTALYLMSSQAFTYNFTTPFNSYTEDYTASNKGESGNKFGTAVSNEIAFNPTNDPSFPYKDQIKTTLTNASYTLNFGDKNNTIQVPANSYAYVEFFVKNNLVSFGSTKITFDVFDVNGDIVKKRASVASLNTNDKDWQKVGFTVNNNYSTTREFFISVVIGPADVAAVDYATEFATGEVYLTYPQVLSGKILEFDEFGNKTHDAHSYNVFSYFDTNKLGSTSLYAGSASDYKEASGTKYDFDVAYSDIGTIEQSPAAVMGWQGIVANHLYVKDDDTGVSTEINKNPSAGLINTEYLRNGVYNDELSADILTKLGSYADEDAQLIAIYNATETSYGYIGTSNSISASSYAKATVTLRVVDNAVANVYLVDTANSNKSIMTFETFKQNVNANGEAIDGQEIEGSSLKLNFTVTSDMMNDDGWLTLEFYVGTGFNARDFRVEVWNGSRDASVNSIGHVFVKNVSITKSAAFSEPSSWKSAATPGNPLYEEGLTEFGDNLILYKRELTDVEIEYNNKQVDSSKKVSYEPTYVWAKSNSMIYAIYNTLDPVAVDPNGDDHDHDNNSGCTAASDPATFWLSFSSVLLGVVLVLAIIMLVIKNVRRRRKANANDAVSHYTVTSRIRKKPVAQKVEDEIVEETDSEEEIEEVAEEQAEEKEEASLDEYVYDNVQDFGEEQAEEKEEVSEVADTNETNE